MGACLFSTTVLIYDITCYTSILALSLTAGDQTGCVLRSPVCSSFSGTRRSLTPRLDQRAPECRTRQRHPNAECRPDFIMPSLTCLGLALGRRLR